jgi:hypothetical protein
MTPLYSAFDLIRGIEEESVDRVMRALDNGVNPNEMYMGAHSLVYALKVRDDAARRVILKLLVEHGADPYAPITFIKDAVTEELHEASLADIIIAEGDVDMITFLLEKDDKIEHPPFHTPICDSVGFSQHTGECWHDAWLEVALFADGLREKTQPFLYGLAEHDITEHLHDVSDPALRKQFLQYLNLVALRFKNHYAMQAHGSANATATAELVAPQTRELKRRQSTLTGIASAALMMRNAAAICPSGSSSGSAQQQLKGGTFDLLIPSIVLLDLELNLVSSQIYPLVTITPTDAAYAILGGCEQVVEGRRVGDDHADAFFMCGGRLAHYDNNYGLFEVVGADSLREYDAAIRDPAFRGLGIDLAGKKAHVLRGLPAAGADAAADAAFSFIKRYNEFVFVLPPLRAHRFAAADFMYAYIAASETGHTTLRKMEALGFDVGSTDVHDRALESYRRRGGARRLRRTGRRRSTGRKTLRRQRSSRRN